MNWNNTESRNNFQISSSGTFGRSGITQSRTITASPVTLIHAIGGMITTMIPTISPRRVQKAVKAENFSAATPRFFQRPCPTQGLGDTVSLLIKESIATADQPHPSRSPEAW